MWSNQHLCNLREGGLEPNCRPSCVATRNSVLSDPGLLIGVDMIPVFSSHYHFSLDDHNSDTMVLECRWPQHEERPLRRKIRRQKLEFSIISDIVKGLLDAAREFHNDKLQRWNLQFACAVCTFCRQQYSRTRASMPRDPVVNAGA